MEYKKFKEIPNLLRKYRRINGYTQKQVAKILGFKSSSQISLWETGKKMPSLVKAARLAVLYRTNIDELFEGHRRVVIEEVKKIKSN